MLILTRRRGEAVMIGEHVKIVVLNVIGNQVRFGIEAPKHIAVHREEVHLRIQKEKENAEADADEAGAP